MADNPIVPSTDTPLRQQQLIDLLNKKQAVPVDLQNVVMGAPEPSVLKNRNTKIALEVQHTDSTLSITAYYNRLSLAALSPNVQQTTDVAQLLATINTELNIDLALSDLEPVQSTVEVEGLLQFTLKAKTDSIKWLDTMNVEVLLVDTSYLDNLNSFVNTTLLTFA